MSDLDTTALTTPRTVPVRGFYSDVIVATDGFRYRRRIKSSVLGAGGSDTDSVGVVYGSASRPDEEVDEGLDRLEEVTTLEGTERRELDPSDAVRGVGSVGGGRASTESRAERREHGTEPKTSAEGEGASTTDGRADDYANAEDMGKRNRETGQVDTVARNAEVRENLALSCPDEETAGDPRTNQERLKQLCQEIVDDVCDEAMRIHSQPEVWTRLKDLTKHFAQKLHEHEMVGTLATRRPRRNLHNDRLLRERDRLSKLRDGFKAEVDEWTRAAVTLTAEASEVWSRHTASNLDADQSYSDDHPVVDVPSISKDVQRAYEKLVTHADRVDQCLRLAKKHHRFTEEACTEITRGVYSEAFGNYDAVDRPKKILRRLAGNA